MTSPQVTDLLKRNFFKLLYLVRDVTARGQKHEQVLRSRVRRSDVTGFIALSTNINLNEV